jgi:hypothetical protein
MKDTQFAVTIPMTVECFDRTWNLVATVSPQGWGCEPAILWLENQGETPWVPELVWEAAEAQFLGGPARIAYDAAMSKADLPFMAEAAE